jgi:hypothetical protein
VIAKRLDEAELGAIEKGINPTCQCASCIAQRRLLGHVAYLTKTLRTVEDNALSLAEKRRR